MNKHTRLIETLERKADKEPSFDVLLAIVETIDALMKSENADKEYASEKIKKIKKKAKDLKEQTGLIEEYRKVFWAAMRVSARFDFESFLLYMEKNRPPQKQFYLPRRKTLKILVNDLQDLEDGKLDFLGISLPPRVGKLISDDTPVLTENGWKNHGDLKVGDYVYDFDGLLTPVTYVFPKNVANKRVWFSDHTYIDCHENHEWIVNDRRKGRECILETKDLEDCKIVEKNGKIRNRFQLPIVDAQLGELKELPVKPYTLGAWLGDGRNGNPDICEPKSDLCIVDSIVADGYGISWHTTHKVTGVEYYGFKNLRNDLQKVGMCYSRKRTVKHIPDEYFTAAIPQRLELLAGLIDTDGCLIRKEHRYHFSTTEEQLKDDFVSLISTFGWRTSVTEQEPKMSSSGIQGRKKVYIISFNPTHEIPCRVERKRLTEFSKQRRISIDKVEDIEPKQGNCISVRGGLYRVGKTMKPTHNSTLCIFFIAWIMGKRPDSHNAMSGHSGILARGFYSELLNLIETPEYTFADIFPENVLANGGMIQKKSADEYIINLGLADRFATMTCRGIDGSFTGSVDISSDGYLYVDDLVRDRTESLSPHRLEGRYQDYLNVLVDRKQDGARELMVGTRWNVMDPLGKVEAQYKDNVRYRFRKIPALNEKSESNFQYDFGVGFSTEYYLNVKSRLDKNEWMAKYQQTPFLREGLLFPEDELRFYNGVLPEDCMTFGACDVAWGGGDSLSMPFGKIFDVDGDIFISDWVFNNNDKYVTKPTVATRIIQNETNIVRFEANNGGDEYAEDVGALLKERNYKINLSWKRASNQMSKLAKIIQYAPDIKRRFVFLSPELQSDEYKKAMEELMSFVQVGKNEHDDAPDSLVQLLQLIEAGTQAKVSVRRRIF